MPNLARVVFDHAKKLANTPGGTLGTALSAFDRGVQATAGQPGPEIKVQPFGPHSYSPGAEILKLGNSVFAAARARANYEHGQKRQDLQDQYMQARTAQATAAAGNRYSYKTPTSGTEVTLTGAELATREAADRAAAHGTGSKKVTGPTPGDIAAALKREGQPVPPTMDAEDERSYRYLYGLENPTEVRADKRRLEGGRFDPRTEAEIASETSAKHAYDAAVSAASGELMSGKTLLNADGTQYTPDPKEFFKPEDSPYVRNNPKVVQARNTMNLNRGRSVMLSLGRAKDFNSIVSGLTLLTPNDELLDDPHGPVATAAVAAARAARKLAKTPEMKHQLDTVLGFDSDTLNPAPQ